MWYVFQSSWKSQKAREETFCWISTKERTKLCKYMTHTVLLTLYNSYCMTHTKYSLDCTVRTSRRAPSKSQALQMRSCWLWKSVYNQSTTQKSQTRSSFRWPKTVSMSDLPKSYGESRNTSKSYQKCSSQKWSNQAESEFWLRSKHQPHKPTWSRYVRETAFKWAIRRVIAVIISYCWSWF